MSCSPPRQDPAALGQRAYSTRLALYRAAHLDLADKVRPPDRRFADAVAQLGRSDCRVAAAIDARNALAGTAEPVVVAVAGAYARLLPVLHEHEAEQEGRLGALRAAELWCPGRGASFQGFARRWIRKFIGHLADRSRAVTRPERARLAGKSIELVEFDPGRAREPRPELEVLVELAAADAEVARLDRALAQLPPLEREAIRLAHGLDGREPLRPRNAAAALDVSVAAYTRMLERALERVRDELSPGDLPRG